MKLLVLSTLLVACSGAAVTKPSEPATLVLRGGDIWTMNAARHVEAVAVRGDTIVALGTDAQIAPWIGSQTKVLALHGASVTPGLVDAHAHLYGLGFELDQIGLRDTTSQREAVARVASSPQLANWRGEWLLGRGWDQNRWDGQFPSAAALDGIVKPAASKIDGPLIIVLRRVDGHAIWVNRAAMTVAGITKHTPDPDGGKLVRDAAGEPTGVFIDNAIDLIERHMPTPSQDVQVDRIKRGAALAVSLGLTGVHEMGLGPQTVGAYQTLAANKQLPLRVVGYLAGDTLDASALASTRPVPMQGRFGLLGVKLFADGALGSRGARLYQPYSDDPQNLGLWVTEPNMLRQKIVAAATNGWQVAVHAIGDAGVGATLDGFAAARASGAVGKLRVEHAQVVAPDDVRRMREVRAIASMQPTHATSDMPWAQKRVGATRILGAYAWRTMLDNDIALAAGSDFPVEEPAPLLGLYAGATRQDADQQPAGGWYPAQRLSLEEVVAAFTNGAAFAVGQEQDRGTIAVGMKADFTIFDRKLRVEDLLATQVMATVVDGEVVYQRSAP